MMTTIISASLVAQTAPYDSGKPLAHATLFAPDMISTGDYESHPTFTPDGHEVYFLKMAPNFSRWTIFVSHYKNGGWSQPEVAPFSGQFQDADPYITADGKHFYFISDRPVETDGERQSHHDICVMDKTESGWRPPRHLPAPINSDTDNFYPIALKNGNLYFGSQRKDSNGLGDIYRAVLQKDGSYTVENLGPPVNTGGASTKLSLPKMSGCYCSQPQSDRTLSVVTIFTSRTSKPTANGVSRSISDLKSIRRNASYRPN
jgi:hypothetical protein